MPAFYLAVLRQHTQNQALTRKDSTEGGGGEGGHYHNKSQQLNNKTSRLLSAKLDETFPCQGLGSVLSERSKSCSDVCLKDGHGQCLGFLLSSVHFYPVGSRPSDGVCVGGGGGGGDELEVCTTSVYILSVHSMLCQCIHKHTHSCILKPFEDSE